MFAKELNSRWQKYGISAYSVHPGGIHTGLQGHVKFGIALLWALVTPFRFKTTQQGVASETFLAVHSDALNNKGE